MVISFVNLTSGRQFFCTASSFFVQKKAGVCSSLTSALQLLLLFAVKADQISAGDSCESRISEHGDELSAVESSMVHHV